MSQNSDSEEERALEDSQNSLDILWSDEDLESNLAAVDELDLNLEEDLALDLEEIDFSWLSSNEYLTLDLGEINFREEFQETFIPPNPHFTAQDIATWMKEQVESCREVHQRDVVSYILRNCGQKFIYRNRNGNFALDQAILKSFFLLTKDTVVWVKKKYYWRKRQAGDSLGRRVDD